MKCVRCEIVRAKLRCFVLFNLGFKIEEIVAELNRTYDGIYVAEWFGENVEIRRIAVAFSAPVDFKELDSALIASFKAESNVNNAV